MGNDIFRAYWIMAHQFGHRRGARGLWVEKNASPFAFEKGDAPAVGMNIGSAATSLKAREGEADVSRHVAVHAK
jgi:hypothetical protein